MMSAVQMSGDKVMGVVPQMVVHAFCKRAQNSEA
jgi:hypothetical protein